MKDQIRPSKAIMTHAAGSIMDLKEGKSGLIMSPDYWRRYDIIHERRLAELLQVRYFRSPKNGDVLTEEGWKKAGILYRRFPYFWYCPKCRRLQNTVNCQWCRDNDEKIPTVPPRLISACKGGHLQDFPWRAWVGCNNQNHIIEIHPSTGESDLEVRCPKCMSEKTPTDKNPHPGVRNLSGALGKSKLKCFGHRPWIGDDEANEDCERILHGLMRGGSNTHFPLIMSSILIPKYCWRIYQKIISGQDLDFVKRIFDMYGEDDNRFKDVLSRAIEAYRPLYIDTENPDYTIEEFETAFLYHCKDKPSANIKLDEWNAFRDPSSPPKRGDEFEFHPEKIDIGGKTFLTQFFDKIIAIKRLTEIIALYGFTRIHPPEGSIQYSNEDKKNRAKSHIREIDDVKWEIIFNEMINGDGAHRRGYHGLVEINEATGQPTSPERRDWLPGIKNKGEGIFFVFNHERLKKWESDSYWNQWTRNIVDNGVNVLNIMQGFEFRPRGLLIHSFSHLLAKQIAKECGYQLASLRERLYCSQKDDTYGALIYTSTPDSQGSLGGLISQAEDLDILSEHLRSVIDSARFCSQDPLCGLNDPESTGKAWGAACHSCTHIPETSCESLMNRFLDRQTISGDGMKKKGYFV